jgi:hypothetical protein
MSENINDTLRERGSRHGQYHEHARIAQNIKRAMQDSPNWATLPDYMKEALEMNAHKTARILNGDPMYADSWHDIIGYTKLVEDRVEMLNKEPEQSIFRSSGSDRWITWEGGSKSPIEGDEAFDILRRDGKVYTFQKDQKTRWEHTGSDWDIMAYRILKC